MFRRRFLEIDRVWGSLIVPRINHKSSAVILWSWSHSTPISEFYTMILVTHFLFFVPIGPFSYVLSHMKKFRELYTDKKCGISSTTTITLVSWLTATVWVKTPSLLDKKFKNRYVGVIMHTQISPFQSKIPITNLYYNAYVPVLCNRYELYSIIFAIVKAIYKYHCSFIIIILAFDLFSFWYLTCDRIWENSPVHAHYDFFQYKHF